MMTGRSARRGIVAALFAVAVPSISAQGPEPELPRLKAHVATLASPTFGGRRGEGGRKAAQYLVDAFRDLKLAPLFDGQYTQDVPDEHPGPPLGRNVGALLRGSDPALRDEWVLVSAHFDHLGVRNGVLYPGADDNASGVAMLLEVARSFSESPEKPRRSVMFVGFDLEEIGLWGSRFFVEHSPVPLKQVVLFVTADMLGRSLGGVCDDYVFVMGTENAPGLRPWIDRASEHRPVKVGMLGTDLLFINRSDYGPFRAKRVPYLFFSTGENPRYHSPDDKPETLNYPKLEAISRVIYGVVRQAAMADAVPHWSQDPDNPLAEAVVIRDVLKTLLDHRKDLGIGNAQALLMTNTLRNADAIIAQGSMTPAERARLVRSVQLILVSIF